MEITPTFMSEDNELICPYCKGNNLHQGNVHHFDRAEDSDNGVHTISHGNGSVSIDNEMEGNPSKRRHGLFIEFYCETCDVKGLRLNIYQHKGITYMGFVWDNFNRENE